MKFDEFNKVFKGFGNEGGTTRTIKSNRSQASEHTLTSMLKELQSNVPNNNLVSFFRTFDSKEKWIVSSSIEKEIKKYTKIPERTFKELCEEMWSIAGISDGYTKVLQYITLIRLKKIYDHT